jgi:hypothetical protein
MKPPELKQYAARYLTRLDEDEGAFFALIEADHAILPILAAAFREEPQPSKRSAILEVIWRHRVPAAVPVLDEALHDASKLVWMEALDGLVTIGSPECLAVLQGARERQLPTQAEAIEFQEAVDEAIEQVQHGSFGEKKTEDESRPWGE